MDLLKKKMIILGYRITLNIHTSDSSPYMVKSQGVNF